MSNTLIRKLDHSGFLTDADRDMLLSVIKSRRHVARHQDLIREGDRPENVLVILDGFACRYKLMPKARRHLMALLIPGDFCDLHVALLNYMDHGISTLSPCEVAEIPRAVIETLTDNRRIARALWWATLVDEATLREWLANMGQRDANRQTAHLFCELLCRLQAVGRATHNSYDLPLTQSDLSDVLGRSDVHMNRILQELRAGGLVAFGSRRLEILDVERLKAYCGFNPNYLHLMPRVNGPSAAAS